MANTRIYDKKSSVKALSSNPKRMKISNNPNVENSKTR